MDELYLRKEMRSTWLVQRLCAPQYFEIGGKKVDNPFSFGGGLRNGGLTSQVMDLLREIFSFDYMGSAEFEFGAVPAALSFLQKQAVADNLCHGELIFKKKNKVYYICPKTYEQEVRLRIELLYKGKIRLKEYCGLDVHFQSDEKRDKKYLGWLELDNGFAFFVDPQMFEKFIKLFGQDVQDRVPDKQNP